MAGAPVAPVICSWVWWWWCTSVLRCCLGPP